jgi:SusD family.
MILKMKKQLYIVAMLCTLAACEMTENPKASVGKEALFASESGLSMYVNSMYDVMPGNGLTVWGDRWDSFYTAYNGVRTFYTDDYTPSQEGSWSWGTLRNINYFLDNNNNPSVDEKVRSNYNGIARFWRAYFYFDKIRTYNDVPWIDHALDIDDQLLHAGRDKRDVVSEHIYEDLQFAIQNISEAYNSTATVVTSLVAAGMQSRFCLWEGTFRKYNNEADADKWLKRAADAARIVMDSGKYSIYMGTDLKSAYRTLFVTKKPIATETMLATEYDASLGLVNGMNRAMTASTLGNTYSPIRQFMNLYLKLDGSRYTDDDAYKTQEFSEEFNGRDLRIAQTIRIPGCKRSTGAAYPDWQVTYTGYMGLKFCTDDAELDGKYMNENNYVFMRYAEVLLNYAEAKAELGTLTDEDWANTIGTLRKRGGITGGLASKPSVADKYIQEVFFPNVSDATILEVRRERLIELVWEDIPGNRSDSQRWNCGDLLGMKWQGIYVKEFNKNIDLDLDGTPDVFFYTDESLKPAKPEGHVVYQYVQLEKGDKYTVQWGVDTDGHTLVYGMLTDKIKWNDRMKFHPISTTDYALNENLGQNPGYSF